MRQLFYCLVAAVLGLCSVAGQAQVAISQTFSNGRNISETEKQKDPQPIIGRAYYDVLYMKDTTRTDSLERDVEVLSYGTYTSDFISDLARKADSAMKAAIERQLQENAGGGNVSLSGLGRVQGGSREHFFTDINLHRVYDIRQLVNSKYLVNDEKPIDWQIQDSTKSIGGYVCQKAIGRSHGRDYTAWFTTDLPYSFGPRRLYGLPGLILEAYDSKHQISYTLQHVETKYTGTETIGLPEKGIVSSAKEYKDLTDAFNRDPQSFIQNQMKGSMPAGAEVKVVVGSGRPLNAGKAKTPRLVLNNPIDLE